MIHYCQEDFVVIEITGKNPSIRKYSKVCIIKNRTGSPSYYRLDIESINKGKNLVNTDIHVEKMRYCKLRYLE